ncbi:MAG: UDP-3-O-(3-hydroxymyristoyl)glucosamine N-acyltransferase [Phycisphaerales bacterium]|nr:UDP-3-O-(3-hydroxymyristoyl)glucosamine N-acyltransferase [Phycisphaerales bacterium]
MTRTATLAELATLVGGELHGDGTRTLSGVAPLDVAQEGEISWLSDLRFAPKLKKTQASALIVPPEITDPPRDAIICKKVDHALAQVMTHFAPPVVHPPQGIDETARIAPGAKIGDNVAIGPYVVIEQGAVVGDGTILHTGVYIGAEAHVGANCTLWPHVVVRERCTLGDRVIIHAQSVIGADGFGYYLHEGRHTRVPHIGGVIIEDDVEIGACSCVDRSKTGNTVIKQGAKIDNLVQVAHNVVVGANAVLCAQVGVAGSARLGSYVLLGGHVGIRDNIELGDGVQVAACSCVPQDVAAGAKVAGLPAIEFRQYLRESASLRKLPEVIAHLRELTKRVEQLESPTDHSPRR